MTRLSPPAQQSRLAVRERVQSLLAESRYYPLSLLVAPAGSGKTTALASFVEQRASTAVWYRLIDIHDPWALLYHLIHALQPLAPTLGLLTPQIQRQVEEQVHRSYDYQFNNATNQDDPEAQQIDLVPLKASLDQLMGELGEVLSENVLLILDDYHTIDRWPELRELVDYLLDIQPQQLNIILSTREHPRLSSLPVREARGELYRITAADLAFTPAETQTMAAFYDQRTETIDPEALTHLCRGWALGVQLVIANLLHTHRAATTTTFSDGLKPDPVLVQRLGRSYSATGRLLVTLTSLTPLLDEYFNQQVFEAQPAVLQQFLLYTANLRWLDSDAIAALPELFDKTHLLAEVERRELFLETDVTGRWMYQPLFHAFLVRLSRQRLPQRQQFHLRAAEYYDRQDDPASVIYHLLIAEETTRAAEILEQAAFEWIKQGAASDILFWLERMPEAVQQRPLLLEAHATAQRSIGHFEQALLLYRQAEEAFQQHDDLAGQVRVLRGQAEIYLDTVQPAPAEELLQRAFDLLPASEHTARIEILRLQAENWANRGRADIALDFETQARTLEAEAAASGPTGETTISQPLGRLSTPLLLARLMLRSGRLNEALEQLESDLVLAPHSSGDLATPVLAHRQPALLLAFVYSLLGRDARALAAARRGLLEAQETGSLLTRAIAHMRVAHAYQVVLPQELSMPQQHYQEALELIETIGVTRTRVEAYMGLSLLHGHRGDLSLAEPAAREALQIADEAGDEWIAALVLVALGGAATIVGDEQALPWLTEAQQRFLKGGDSYGQALVALWRALWYLRAGARDEMSSQIELAMTLTQEHGYAGLLTAQTLFGPRDLSMLIPLLLHARTLSQHGGFAEQLLRQAFPSVATDEMVEDYHPGYTLRIQMLGNFRVWRGIREVQGREWQREKARQLLQLLLTYRGQWLQREQICAWLWPDSDLESAERQFKVTLNALNAALEPARPPRTMPFFVRRQGLAYSFAPSYGCWIDVDEFELRTTSVAQSDVDFQLRNSQIAVQLYKGDYLAESLYDSWTLEERERLMARYLATATTLADRLLERGESEEVVELCEQVLRRDRCFEEAYQVLMKVYARNGSRSQALRTYARCSQALQDELGIEPLPETTQLYERIKQNEAV